MSLALGAAVSVNTATWTTVATVTGDGTNYGGAGAALAVTLAWSPVRPLDTSREYSVVIKEINANTGDVVQTATDNGTGGFTGNVSAGAISYGNGAITAFKFTAAPASGNKILAFYSYDGELNSKIPSQSMDISKKTVEAKPRRIKILASSEALEDLRSQHGIETTRVPAPSSLAAANARWSSLPVDNRRCVSGAVS